jgi:dipeptidyl aminopeptidase/acylaminoacyl peptidase
MRAAVAPEAVTFRAEDGLEVRAQLFRGRGCTRCPAIVYAHGGPRRQMLLGFHPSSYYSKAYALNQHLAARGYHVLSVNYRSGTGYGLAFRDAPETGREGASEYRDILAAGRWLAARPEVDANRIGIWGGSWGGYLTALALARNSDLFAAASTCTVCTACSARFPTASLRRRRSVPASCNGLPLRWRTSNGGAPRCCWSTAMTTVTCHSPSRYCWRENSRPAVYRSRNWSSRTSATASSDTTAGCKACAQRKLSSTAM